MGAGRYLLLLRHCCRCRLCAAGGLPAESAGTNESDCTDFSCGSLCKVTRITRCEGHRVLTACVITSAMQHPSMTTPVVDDTRTARSGVVTGSTCAATSTLARTAAVPPLSQATWPTPMSPAAFSLPLAAAGAYARYCEPAFTRVIHHRVWQLRIQLCQWPQSQEGSLQRQDRPGSSPSARTAARPAPSIPRHRLCKEL